MRNLPRPAVTNLNGGTLDPPTIDIEGGTFGGAGTVVADTVTLTGSTLQVGNAAGDQLRISTGAYSQTGGEIVFDIRPRMDTADLRKALWSSSPARTSISEAPIFCSIFVAAPTRRLSRPMGCSTSIPSSHSAMVRISGALRRHLHWFLEIPRNWRGRICRPLR